MMYDVSINYDYLYFKLHMSYLTGTYIKQNMDQSIRHKEIEKALTTFYMLEQISFQNTYLNNLPVDFSLKITRNRVGVPTAVIGCRDSLNVLYFPLTSFFYEQLIKLIAKLVHHKLSKCQRYFYGTAIHCRITKRLPLKQTLPLGSNPPLLGRK